MSERWWAAKGELVWQTTHDGKVYSARFTYDDSAVWGLTIREQSDSYDTNAIWDHTSVIRRQSPSQIGTGGKSADG